MDASSGAILQLVGSGVVGALAVERLTKLDARCGSLLTFCQMLGITAGALPAVLAPDGLQKRQIPLPTHLASVSLVFSSMLLSNKALEYAVPLPLHIILKSASLPANFAIGAAVLRKRYSLRQTLSVLGVTAGIVAATLASSSTTSAAAKAKGASLVGVACAASSVLLSSGLGVVQERAYAKHGHAWQESLFYSHALSLPLFLLFRRDIVATARRWAASAALRRQAWPSLALSVLSCNVAMAAIYRTTVLTSSLTCTLSVTVRKFISLLLSVALFNPSLFTKQHWLGALAVFGGTLSYVTAPPPPSPAHKA